jgi:hydrogenase expression/formation protein HypD
MDLSKYRHPELVSNIVDKLARWKEPVKFMEVCGSHTMAIGQWGLRKLLPDSIKLISGPGCPVCVTPSCVIDALFSLEGVTIATFGDLLHVPGSRGTLADARANGLDVRLVYSSLEALELSKERETIFVGIGFETTIPGIAQTIQIAKKENLSGFSVLPIFKTIPPALDALLSSEEVDIDGLILPGHVSVIIGWKVYSFIPRKYGTSCVVAGFEPLDIMVAIERLINQIETNSPRVDNEYTRVVTPDGNLKAQEFMQQVLQPTDTYWRGLGLIPNSGLKIRDEYARFDAAKKYDITLDFGKNEDNINCRCADVLKGKLTPPQCPLFKTECHPHNPLGPCMVSSEGSCAAYYKYET